MNKQLVLVEFKNTEPFLYEILSEQEIDIEKVVKYFKISEGFNEERDNITFLDKKISEINIDKCEKERKRKK